MPDAPIHRPSPRPQVIGTRYSIQGGGDQPINLVGDQQHPPAGYYYGTDDFGRRGFYELPESSPGGGSGDVISDVGVSVANELVKFSDTTGKHVTRATGTGLAKITSGVLSVVSDNSSNWNTAFSDRLKWDGGATGLVAATGRASLDLEIGTDVQAWSSNLDAWSALATSAKVTANAGITGATKTKITYDTKGLVTAGADATTADIADSSNKRYVTDADLVDIGNLSGTNTGDQATIVGVTGTKAQFDTACTDGNFLYVGDVSQYTDELAQDAVGGMVDATLEYIDATPLLKRAALTGAITASSGSNATALGSFTTAQLNTALSDNDVATGGGTASGANTGDQTSIVGISGTLAQFNTACSDADFVPAVRSITINGTAQDLSADRSWTVTAPSKTNADAPNSTTAINVLTGAPATLVTKTYTIAAGDQVTVNVKGSILNNSGGTKTYSCRCSLGTLTADLVWGATVAASATNRVAVEIEATFSVKASNSAWMHGRFTGGTAAALGTSGAEILLLDQRVVQQAATDQTGSKAVTVAMFSSANNATQSFEMIAWSIDKVATNP